MKQSRIFKLHTALRTLRLEGSFAMFTGTDADTVNSDLLPIDGIRSAIEYDGFEYGGFL